MDIGRAIETCRKIKRFSKTELAERAELSISYLSLLEKGTRQTPNLAALEKIATKGLGIPLSLLLFLATDDEEASYLKKATRDELKKAAMELLKQDSKSLFPQVPGKENI